jgi:glycine/D-amino acid oxidase-like deaminating enzyme
MPPLNRLAIIGGGLAGISLAYEFSQRGVRCTVFEAESCGGAGASAMSRGIVRVYDPDPWLMSKALQGLRRWQHLNKGFPGLFVQCGCLYLLKAEQTTTAQAALMQLADAGYQAQWLNGPADIVRCQPLLANRALPADQCAIWEPEGGYVNTRLACQVLAQWARDQGAVILEGCSVTAIELQAQQVAVWALGQGALSFDALSFDALILAGGARSTELLPDTDLFCRSIPLSLLQAGHQPALAQCLIDETCAAYLRPEPGGWFFAGGADQIDVPHPALLPDLEARVFQQNQQLAVEILANADLTVQGQLSGFDAYRPGFKPLIQTLSATESIGVFTGFSGRGAKYIPALAQEFAATCLQSVNERLKTEATHA